MPFLAIFTLFITIIGGEGLQFLFDKITPK